MKGVLLAGGRGQRLKNFTTTVTNKHLAPVYSKDGATPMIDYPIDTLKKMGITDILVITSREHCGDIVEHLGDGYERGLNFTYKIQEMNDPERPIGIASALKLARDFTGGDNFVVILGDNYFEPNVFYKQILDEIEYHPDKFKCGLFLQKTDEWQRFGVAKLEEKHDENGIRHIEQIVEKPKEFVSDLAVTGMYIYTPDVYQYLEELTPSQRGELEISDINNMYCKKHLTFWGVFDMFWHDMGTPSSMIEVQNFLNNEKDN
jgi:glucose-1-phosphate thymidylyltransferase